METRCHRCGKSRFLVDSSTGSPVVIGCLECDWDKALEYEWPDGPRCVAHSRSGYRTGSRCERRAILSSGYCWQHTDKADMWEVVYQRFRNSGRDDIPDAYRQTFNRALRDAGIIIRDARHEAELGERVKAVRAKPERGPSLVYFVEREGLIKIGVTTNLESRLKALGRGSCMPDGMTVGPVRLLATESGDRRLEASLHARFRRSRVSGTEWFRPSKALNRYIEDLARAQQRAGAA